MKRILVLGATGMLGHAALLTLSELLPDWDVCGTVRRTEVPDWISRSGIRPAFIVTGVDAQRIHTVEQAVRSIGPTVVLNCIGIVKQLPEGTEAIPSIRINALFPHELHRICRVQGTRLIHVSTDCVFSGGCGNYSEDDRPDATDLYGITKRLGEVIESPAITLRTSIIGPEIHSSLGLVEWFLSQRGDIEGYENAFFSGLTTIEFCRAIAQIVNHGHNLHGLYHVAGSRISKLDLLLQVARIYGKVDVNIRPSDKVRIDRSLVAARFERQMGYRPPSWEGMIDVMHRYHREWKAVYGK